MNTSGAELSVAGLRKTYRSRGSSGEVVAIDNITLDVAAGEFCAIVGPSGCGKTTFLNIVAGLDYSTAGSLTVKGRNVTGPAAERGVVFQDYALFPWKTVWQNVEFGPRARGVGGRERRAIVQHWIDAVGLSGFEDRYPHELSGGMKQRCALSRAFANDPGMLLMDEPLAAVDAQTRRILQDELLAVWGERRTMSDRRTVLYVTHSIEEAVYLADRVVVMSARPGHIKQVVDNGLRRPRAGVRTETEFVERCAELWELLVEDAEKSIGC